MQAWQIHKCVNNVWKPQTLPSNIPHSAGTAMMTGGFRNMGQHSVSMVA